MVHPIALLTAFEVGRYGGQKLGKLILKRNAQKKQSLRKVLETTKVIPKEDLTVTATTESQRRLKSPTQSDYAINDSSIAGSGNYSASKLIVQPSARFGTLIATSDDPIKASRYQTRVVLECPLPVRAQFWLLFLEPGATAWVAQTGTTPTFPRELVTNGITAGDDFALKLLQEVELKKAPATDEYTADLTLDITPEVDNLVQIMNQAEWDDQSTPSLIMVMTWQSVAANQTMTIQGFESYNYYHNPI